MSYGYLVDCGQKSGLVNPTKYMQNEVRCQVKKFASKGNPPFGVFRWNRIKKWTDYRLNSAPNCIMKPRDFALGAVAPCGIWRASRFDKPNPYRTSPVRATFFAR